MAIGTDPEKLGLEKQAFLAVDQKAAPKAERLANFLWKNAPCTLAVASGPEALAMAEKVLHKVLERALLVTNVDANYTSSLLAPDVKSLIVVEQPGKVRFPSLEYLVDT